MLLEEKSSGKIVKLKNMVNQIRLRENEKIYITWYLCHWKNNGHINSEEHTDEKKKKEKRKRAKKEEICISKYLWTKLERRNKIVRVILYSH